MVYLIEFTTKATCKQCKINAFYTTTGSCRTYLQSAVQIKNYFFIYFLCTILIRLFACYILLYDT